MAINYWTHRHDILVQCAMYGTIIVTLCVTFHMTYVQICYYSNNILKSLYWLSIFWSRVLLQAYAYGVIWDFLLHRNCWHSVLLLIYHIMCEAYLMWIYQMCLIGWCRPNIIFKMLITFSKLMSIIMCDTKIM